VKNGVTIAGGHGKGSALNQLSEPCGIYVDDDQTLFLADLDNHRIVAWKPGATSGQVVAGGNGSGNRPDQLSEPIAVIIDKETDSLIICDTDNRRVVRWSLRNRTFQEIIIENIECVGLAMDEQRCLYISHPDRVTRYRMGEASGTVVAGGNGRGNNLNQLNCPTFVFVDRDHSVYVSDWYNHRVMKWLNGAKEGVVVAGDRGLGDALRQLHAPRVVLVDQLGTVYVADYGNHRVSRWREGAVEGDAIVGGNGRGKQNNQFNQPLGLSFDWRGNLYVVDCHNHRVQQFLLEK
jgi:DNA-binding beta-propeller fold protein YncE